MKQFIEVIVRVVYYANKDILMSTPVLSGVDPYADDCYNDNWN